MLRRGQRNARAGAALVSTSGGKRLANRSAAGCSGGRTRLFEDAQLCTPRSDHRPEAFVDPRNLEPEERSSITAAVGCSDAFGDRPGRATDLGWSTHLADLGVDLVDRPGIALDLPDGRRELRVLHLGTRHLGAPLLDGAAATGARPDRGMDPDQLTIVAADVIEQELQRETPDLARDRAEAHEWITARVELVKELAADGRTKVGSDCSGCPFIAGCDRFQLSDASR